MDASSLSSVNSVLILDDDEDTLEQLQALLSIKMDAEITTTLLASQAEVLAKNNFFDFILIDVSLNYRGSQWGGVELYKKLLSRYGNASLIIYSQYVKDDLLKQYDICFNFISKGHNIVKFIDRVLSKMSVLKKKQTCFIAMPFDKKFDKCFLSIKNSVKACQYKPIRIDKQYFTSSILQKIWNEVHNAKLVVFFCEDNNPNVFYECGYAVALNKEVITITNYFENLPFDVRERSVIEYKNDFDVLEKEILAKLANITKDV